jgi:hypothetical protein
MPMICAPMAAYQGKALWGEEIMSEGSFWPKTWKEAIPLAVWALLIFAAGFEYIASPPSPSWSD